MVVVYKIGKPKRHERVSNVGKVKVKYINDKGKAKVRYMRSNRYGDIKSTNPKWTVYDGIFTEQQARDIHQKLQEKKGGVLRHPGLKKRHIRRHHRHMSDDEQ